MTTTTNSSAEEGYITNDGVLVDLYNNIYQDDVVIIADIESQVATISTIDVPASASIELNSAPELLDAIVLYAGIGYDLDWTLEGETFATLFDDEG